MTTNTAENKTSAITGGYDVALRARVASNGTGPWTDVTNGPNVSSWVGQTDVALRERTSAILISALQVLPVAGARRLDKCTIVNGAWKPGSTADFLFGASATAYTVGANMIQPVYVAGDYTLVGDNGITMTNPTFYTAANASVANANFTGKYAWATYTTGTATTVGAWTYLPVTRLDQFWPGG